MENDLPGHLRANNNIRDLSENRMQNDSDFLIMEKINHNNRAEAWYRTNIKAKIKFGSFVPYWAFQRTPSQKTAKKKLESSSIPNLHHLDR